LRDLFKHLNADVWFAEAMREVSADQGDDVAEVDLSGLVDVVFMNLDFETLFEPATGGIQHTEVGRQMIVNLDRSQWFERVDGSAAPPHSVSWTGAR
jgi:hypothetical protein